MASAAPPRPSSWAGTAGCPASPSARVHGPVPTGGPCCTRSSGAGNTIAVRRVLTAAHEWRASTQSAAEEPMTRRRALCVALLTALAGLASPARAQAPAPKVTIEGFFDFEASLSKNWSDADITNARDTLGYTRERGRLFFIGEVGKSKMEWALELDFTNGQTVTGAGAPGTSRSEERRVGEEGRCRW